VSEQRHGSAGSESGLLPIWPEGWPCYAQGMFQLKKSVNPVKAIELDQYVPGDTTVWPAGQTTLNVTFSDSSGKLPAYGVLRADYDSSVLTAMRITSLNFRQSQKIGQAGSGIAAADFAVFSGEPSNTLFPMPNTSFDVTATFAVNTAPLAAEDVVFHLRPPEELPAAMAEAVKRRASGAAKRFASQRLPLVVQRAAAKKRPGVLSKFKRAGSAIWRRLPFVAGAGVAGLSDQVAGELVAALGQADYELEQVGAEALDEYVLGLAGALGEELAESEELSEFVGDLIDVLGNVWMTNADDFE